MALDYGRIVGFTAAFVTIHHPIRGGGSHRIAQSHLSTADLKPPYRIIRPFSRFDGPLALIAFELDGREALVSQDQVVVEKGSLMGRSRSAAVSLTQISLRQVKIWYGPPPEAEPTGETIGQTIALKVKPLRLAVATCVAIFFYLLAGQIDPLGALSAADNYSNILYQQIYRAAHYEREGERQYPGPGADPPQVVVVELLEDDLNHYDESWPASYDFHAWFLDALAAKKPAAVFVDIAFIDDRSYAGDDWDEETPEEKAAKGEKDPQRFFGGASAYLGEVIAAYRQMHKIPLMFAATPCFPPFFLPKDVPKHMPDGAGTRALDVPGGRFHRQGTRYPLWNHQSGKQICFEDTRQKQERRFVELASGERDLSESPSGIEQESKEAKVSSAPAVGDDGSLQTIKRKPRVGRSLPSAACGVFDAIGHLAPVNHKDPICPQEKLANPAVEELNLHWSTRSFDWKLADGSTALRNGRYACRQLPDSWWSRLMLLVFEFDKDRTFEFRSPLRQICPPVLSLHVGQILDPDQLLDKTDPLAALEGAVVIYAQNLTGLEDRFTPPTHLPLNGAYFHAMAIDNLLTYRGPEKLLQKNEFLGVPYPLILMLLGFIAVVPLWEYGLMLLARVERAGEAARTRAAAFRFYAIWLAGVLLLPLLAAVVVVELILLTTFLFPGAALNFIGLLSLIGLRSLPRLWRLMPPLWLGLGGWGRRKAEEPAA